MQNSRVCLALCLAAVGGFGARAAGAARDPEGTDAAIRTTRVTAVRDAYPYWSPDGTEIVFQSDRDSPMTGSAEIYVMQADGTNIRRLTHRPEADETPVWSPDGAQILFSSYLDAENNELFLMNADGSGLVRLTDQSGRDGHAKFAPDGRSIIFNSQRDDDGRQESMNYEIYEMNLDGTNVRRLTHFDGWDTYPSIAPDGARIVWRRVLASGGDSETGRNSEIFLMNRDGTEPRNLTNHPAFDGYPSWSPDGSKIVFASNREGKGSGDFHIYVMDADGSNPVRLLEGVPGGEDARPIWSPDGTRIVFNRQYVADESSIDILIIELPPPLRVDPLHGSIGEPHGKRAGSR